MTDPALAYYRGDDLFSMERAADALGAGVAAGGQQLERWRVAGDGVDAARIAERVATAPLFGGGTLAIVSDPGPLVRSQAGRAEIIGVLGSVAPGNALVFLEAVDGSGRRTASLDALREAVGAAGGDLREFKAPREGQLAGWIEQRARERAVHLGRGAAQALAQRIGGFVREGDVDRRRQGQLAVAELEKLALYRPGAEVSTADVAALVAEAVPASTWAFLDALAHRRVRQATDLLERLLPATPEPLLVAHVHRRLRELVEVADRLSRGERPASLVRSMKLKPYRAEILAEQARAWTVADLGSALEGLLALDVAAKGADGRLVTDGQRRLAWLLWISERVGRRG